MKNPNQALGRWGEQLAASYLYDRGYIILERNARTPYGEIDLVVRQESNSVASADPLRNSTCMLVFVEVKTRRSTAYGFPEESITKQKQAHILAAAQAYLQAHPELEGDWRVDVISIQQDRDQPRPIITHFENAITQME